MTSELRQKSAPRASQSGSGRDYSGCRSCITRTTAPRVASYYYRFGQRPRAPRCACCRDRTIVAWRPSSRWAVSIAPGRAISGQIRAPSQPREVESGNGYRCIRIACPTGAGPTLWRRPMALARRGSRRIAVDGLVFRWLVRRRPTYCPPLGWSPLTLVAELADESGARLVVALPYAHPGNWLGLPSASVRPATVVEAIRQGLSAGWQPRRPGPAFTLAFDEAYPSPWRSVIGGRSVRQDARLPEAAEDAIGIHVVGELLPIHVGDREVVLNRPHLGWHDSERGAVLRPLAVVLQTVHVVVE